MKRLHFAVNFIDESSSTVLCRCKELGNASRSFKLPLSAFKGEEIAPYHNFVAGVGDVVQAGNYYVPGEIDISDVTPGVKPIPVDLDELLK